MIHDPITEALHKARIKRLRELMDWVTKFGLEDDIAACMRGTIKRALDKHEQRIN